MKKFLYSYLFFCLTGLGFLLCFLEIFPSSLETSWLFSLCLFLPLAFALLHYTKCRAQFSIPLLLLLTGFCWIKREEIFLQSSLMFQRIKAILEELYSLSPSSSYHEIEGPGEYVCLLLLTLYFLFLLLAVLKKRKAIFFCLLLLAIIPGYVVNLPPARTALGCFLAAFLLWEEAVFPKNPLKQWLPKTGFLLVLYGLCAWVLTPALSPWLFQNSQKLHSFINQTGARLFDNKAAQAPSAASDDSESRAFTYEIKEKTQTISNIAPAYTGQSMFHFSADRLLQDTFYLRGFIGQDYNNGSWTAPDKNQWYLYAQQNNLSKEEAAKFYGQPYKLGESLDTYTYSLEFYFSPAFSYLPYGSEVLEDSPGENNAFPAEALDSRGCFPLSLSTAPQLLGQEVEESSSLSASYRNFSQDFYTSWEAQEMALVQEELESLPVYSSMPENPDIEDITKAAGEIQNFLWEHATYSLSMETPPKTVSRLEDFLYGQKKGFCVHFATAGTLLFRMYGIPARYVSGYAFPASLLDENVQGHYSGDIPDSTAHAWTEIYIDSIGWVPVEVTPSAEESGSSTDLPNTDSSQDIPEEDNPENQQSQQKDDTSSALEKENAGKSPAPSSAIRLVLVFFKYLLYVLLTLFFFAAVLLTRQNILFRKRLGYLSSGPRRAYLCIFKSLTKLFLLSYPVEGKHMGDQEFYQALTEKLPPEKRDGFLDLYWEAQAFAFGPKAPKAKDIRSLRSHYLFARKEFLASQTPVSRLYYRFIRVL